MNNSLYEKLKDRVRADAEREQRELEVHPDKFVVFRVERWKEERGQDKKIAVREIKHWPYGYGIQVLL